MLQMKTTHLLDIIKKRKNMKLLFFLLFWKTRNEGAVEMSFEQKGTVKP